MEHIDGHPVVAHRVRFTNRADITEDDALQVRDGETVIWVVQARCQPPSYHQAGKNSHDRYRYNAQTVERAAVLTGLPREAAIAFLDDPAQEQGYLSFVSPRHPDYEHAPPEPEDEALPEPYPTDSLPLFELGDDGPQVVASLYKGGETETQRLLRETWGAS